MQLNKFLAHAGVCSRRKAVELIETGRVVVNGAVIDQPGFRVPEKARVAVDGEGIRCQEKMYIMLNKPRGYITTLSDQYNRKTVMDLLAAKLRRNVYPVGRLDQDSTGLLLFTNDGSFAQQIAHPSKSVAKQYHVALDKPITAHDLEAIKAGVHLSDGLIKVDHIAYLPIKPKYTQVTLTIHSGKNRIVRRLFEHLSYKVIRLDRVAIGPLALDSLPIGKWRYISENELNSLNVLQSKSA